MLKVFPSIKFYSSWSWDFYLVMVMAATAQLLPVIFDFIRTPFKMLKFLSNFTLISISTILPSFANILSYLITRRSFFPVTGSKSSGPEPNTIFFVEMMSSLILTCIAVYTANIWLLTIALALGLDPLLYSSKWKGLIFNSFAFVPFISNVVIMSVLGFYIF